MGVFESIKDFLAKRNNNEKVAAPAGFCPNCWGRQEYEDNFFEAMKLENVNDDNLKDKSGWIQAYVKKNLSPIVLKEQNDDIVCSKCSISYKKED